MLRLATEITTPIPARRPKPAAPRSEAKPKGISPTDAKTLDAVAVAPQPAVTPPVVPPAKPEPATAASKAAVGDGKIDRRSNASVRERADAEFRRATAFVNQGRIAEAMEALTSTLSIDPGHESARQTAVGLQLENRRVDDAQHLLQDGIVLNPAQTGFAMLLARIQVERADLNGGLATLQKHGATAGNNPDYLAFSAAILQRLGRHREAADIYQAVLRLQPGSGVWWMGLGISLQALKQPAEAVEAFRRARGAGSLSPELTAFVEQRIKQLQQ
jgi:MSHA biogenesis protein MshN